MIGAKVCLVGAFAVGKTSLVRQFVESIFSDKYHTTIGVKINKKSVSLDEADVQLMIWDIEGVDIFTSLKPSYLRGAEAVIYVIDGTRPDSIKVIEEIKSTVNSILDEPLTALLVNKVDLIEDWKINNNDIKLTGIDPELTFETSAKTGLNVDKAFISLAQAIINKKAISASKKA